MLRGLVKEPGQALTDIADALLTTSVTLLTVAISVMVLVLSMTSQQISPRALTEQLRRPLFRNATGFLFGCFATGAAVQMDVYSVILPETLEAVLAVICAALLFGAVWAFVGTIQNAASNLQINKILFRLNVESRAAIDDYFARFDPLETANEADGFDEEGEAVFVESSGYVEHVDWVNLTETARTLNVCVRVVSHEGDFNGLDSPVLHVIGADNLAGGDWDEIRGCVRFSPDRAPEQHPYRALSVVADIALKGLSPAYNDPTTAMSAVDYLSDLLVTTLRKPDERRILIDDEGGARVQRRIIAPREAFDHAFRQITHYSAGNDGFTVYLTDTVRRLALSDISDEGKAAALWFLAERIGVEGPASETASD